MQKVQKDKMSVDMYVNITCEILTFDEETSTAYAINCSYVTVKTHSLYISSQSHSTQAYENFVSCFSQPSKQSQADQKISEWTQTIVKN